MAKEPPKSQPKPDESKVKRKLKEIGNSIVNDGTISQFLAHGATELANVIVHGHPAPMYAHSTSPNIQKEVAPNQETNTPSLIDQHLNAIGVTQPEGPTVHGPVAPSDSLIDQHLQEVTSNTPEIHHPQQELER